MKLKGFTWGELARFLPRWFKARSETSVGSRVLGYPGLFLDFVLNLFRRRSETNIVADPRQPTYLDSFPITTEPSAVRARKDDLTITLEKAADNTSFEMPQITRLSLQRDIDLQPAEDGVKYIPDGHNAIGLVSYLSNTLTDRYTDIVTDIPPSEVGSIVRYSIDDKTFSYHNISNMRLDFTVERGHDIVHVRKPIPVLEIEENLNYSSISYDPTAVYTEHTHKLKHIPKADTIKLVDLVQHADGVVIPERGLDVSYGLPVVYGDVAPKFRTWWSYDPETNELTIYNPISSKYVVLYEYNDVKTGPATTSKSWCSINLQAPKVFVPTIFWNNKPTIDIERADLELLSDRVTGKYFLDGALFPPGSRLVYEVDGILSLSSTIVLDETGYGETILALSDYITPRATFPSSLTFDFLSMSYTSNGDVHIYHTFDDNGWPIIHVSGSASSVNVHIPFKIKDFVFTKRCSDSRFNSFLNIPIQLTEVDLSPSTFHPDIRQLLSLSVYRTRLYKIRGYSGIDYYQWITRNREYGYVVSDYTTKTIRFFDSGMSLVGAIPAGGLTQINQSYQARPFDYELGPLFSLDEFVYYIAWKEVGDEIENHLFRLNPYTSEVKDLGVIYTGDYIRDISYCGDTVYACTKSRLLEYKTYFDVFLYDSTQQTVYVREPYDGVDII